MKLLKNEYFIIFIIDTLLFVVRTIVFFYEFSPTVLLLLYPLSYVVLVLNWIILKNIHLYLDRKVPYQPQKMLQRVTLEVILGLAFAIIHINLVILANNYLVKFFLIDKKVIVAIHISGVLAILLVNAGFIGYYYFVQWKNALHKAEKLEKEKSQVQFDNLKNQFNPHFLFNSLTSLNSLIFENQELASQFLQQLSKVYRYLLLNHNKDLVSLQTELDFIRHYQFLLQTRFKNLHIEIQIPEQDKDKKVIPVTLQLLIENAIKHNVIAEGRELQIYIYLEKDYLAVRNNLQKKNLVENSNRQGLENLKNLYTFLTDKKLEILENGKEFTVKVPLL